MAPSARNGKVEFLRFFFSCLIILNHAQSIMPTAALTDRFKGFSFAVEFFFLVSGYLMMAHIEKVEQRGSSLTLGKETGLFIFKKFKSVYPEMAIAYIIALSCSAVATARPITTVFANTWSEVFLIASTGVRFSVVNAATWYISSMLLCMTLLYPLIRKYKDMVVRIVLPVMALLILGYMAQNLGTPRNPSHWIGWIFRGNLRAMAELSLGALCYYVSKRIRSWSLNLFGRILLTLVETGIYAIYVYYMASVVSSKKDYLILMLLCVAVSITFSQQGIGSALFNNRFCSFLGKYSLSLYLGHRFYPSYFEDLFPFTAEWRVRYSFLFYIALSFATGALIMLISSLLRKYGGKITGAAKKLVLKPSASAE